MTTATPVCDLLVERALSDGQRKALKNRRRPRTVELLAPLRDDLSAWRSATISALTAPVFPSGPAAARASS